jgi:hypothetical protein
MSVKPKHFPTPTSVLFNLRDWQIITLISCCLFLLFLFAYQIFDFHFLFHSDTAYFTFHKLSIIKHVSSEGDLFPLYNRFEGAGVPLFPAGSVDPAAFLFLRWFKVLDYQVVSGFFYVAWSFVSFYFLLRELKCSIAASLAGSFIWALNAFNLNYANEQVYAIFHIVVPFSLLAIKRLLHKHSNRFLWFPLLVIATGFLLLTGRWALVQYCFVFYVFWSVSFSNSWASASRIVGSLFLVLFCAFFLTCYFSYPYIFEVILSSYRSSEPASPKYVHWLRLLLDHLAPGLSSDAASYFTPLVFIPFAVLGYWTPSRIRIFCLITLLVFIFLSHDFGIFSLIQKLPLQSGNVVTIRFVFFYYLGFAIAAAVGFDRFFANWPLPTQRMRSVFESSAITIALLLASLIIIALVFSAHREWIDEIRDLALRHPPLLNPIIGPVKTLFGLSAFTLLLVGGIAYFRPTYRRTVVLSGGTAIYFSNVSILLLIQNHTPDISAVHFLSFASYIAFLFVVFRTYFAIHRIVTFAFLIAYTIVFSILFNAKMADPEYDLIATHDVDAKTWSEIGDLISQETKPFRVAAEHESVVRLAIAGINIEEIGYYLPLPPTSLVDFFSELLQIPSGPAPARKSIASNFYRLGNVKYYVISATSKDRASEFLLSDEYKLVFSQDNFYVFEDILSFPRVSFVTQYLVREGSRPVDSMLEREDDLEFFRNHVLLDQPPHVSIKQSSAGETSIALNKYSSGVYDISLSTTKDGVLIIADRFDRNWHFTVDGISVKHISANQFFVGIPILSGDHEIHGTYRLAATKAKLLVSVATFFLLAVSIFRGIIRQPKSISHN